MFFFSNLSAFKSKTKAKQTRLLTVPIETVRMAKPDQERTNKKAQIHLKITLP